MRLRIRVTPRASRDAVEARAGIPIIHVTVPAVDGRANHAARRLLAATLGLRAPDIVIERGARARDKIVRVPDSAASRMSILLGQ